MADRGTTTDRGYGAEHQRLRLSWKPKVQAGIIDCWRCEQPIRPDEEWDLGHDDHDRTKYRGPEHRGRECPRGGNRGVGGAKGAAVTHAKRTTTIREW